MNSYRKLLVQVKPFILVILSIYTCVELLHREKWTKNPFFEALGQLCNGHLLKFTTLFVSDSPSKSEE